MILKDGLPYILEVNSIPGLTSNSLLPKAAKNAGIEFPDLCFKLIELAYEKK
jgi:D-alanine-D-alanine ligase